MKNVRPLFIFILLFFFFIVHGQKWKVYADSAFLFNKENKNEKADEYYNKARAFLITDSSSTATLAAIDDSLGRLSISLQKYKDADTFYQESKTIREKFFGPNSLEYALSSYNLGYLYTQFLDRYKEAQVLLETAKKIRETLLGKENMDYALTCKFLGTVHLHLGENSDALKLYLEAKSIMERLLGEDNVESAKVTLNIGSIYFNTGNYLNAEAYYKQARDEFEKSSGKKSYLYLATTINLANLYYASYQMEKGLPLLLAIEKTIGETFGKNSPLFNYHSGILGQIYRDMGNLEPAEKKFLELINIDEKTAGKETQAYAADCYNLAQVYFLLGQYEKSENYFLESKNLREKIIGKNNPGYIGCCTGLASLYIKMKEYAKAESLILESRQIREYTEGRSRGYIGDCNLLANLYLKTKQYAKAEKILSEGEQVDKLISKNNQLDDAYLCINQADLCFSTSRYTEAGNLYLEAKNIIESSLLTEHPDYILIYKKMAELEWKQKKYDSAYALFTKSISLQKNQLNKIFQFTSENEKQSYLNMVSNLSDCFYSFDLTGHSPKFQSFAYNNAFANRGLILSSSERLTESINNFNDTAAANRYNEWVDIKKQLANFYAQSTDQSANIAALEEKSNALEKELTRLVSTFKNDRANGKISWKAIQQKLLSNEAAIEFVAFNYYDISRLTDSTFYIALLLRKEASEPQLVRLFEERELDDLLRQNTNGSSESRIASLYTSIANSGGETNSLFNIIWRPIEKDLKGITKIYFALAGNLHKISFAALPVDNKTVLSDKYELVQLNTTASVIDKSSYVIATSDKIKLIGGVQYDADSSEIKRFAQLKQTNLSSRSLPDDIARSGSWSFLPGTEKEINTIEKTGKQKNYSINISSGALATEESIKALNGKASPVILHIATHGFFFPDPKNEPEDNASELFEKGKVFRKSENPLFRSGLLFAGANYAWSGKPVEGIEDGILTAYEVSNIYLPNTKLVVLSACETALGDIKGSEGVYGLQRAFTMAGVKNLVMSLWKVPDQETSEFMELFYNNMFAKQSVSDAFYHAQSAMKKKYKNDPYKWAAWVLVR